MLNTLESNLLDPSTKENALHEAIDKLIHYTEYHFSKEEDAMTKYGYPELIEHKKEHDSFKNVVKTFASKVEYGSLPTADDVMHSLIDWLVKHIMKTDMGYGPLLKDRGFSG